MSRSRSFRMSPWPIILPVCAVAMAIAVFAVTQNVQHREARVTELNRALLSEQQTLRVLDAEWAYLTRPQRLEELLAVKQDIAPPPLPTPVTNVATVEPEAPIVVAEAAVQPQAPVDVMPEKDPAPVAVIDTPNTIEIEPAAGHMASAKARAVKADAAKKVSAPVKKTAYKPASTHIKKASAVSMNDAWPIAKKTVTPQPHTRTAASALPVRAGVARPIVE